MLDLDCGDRKYLSLPQTPASATSEPPTHLHTRWQFFDLIFFHQLAMALLRQQQLYRM